MNHVYDAALCGWKAKAGPRDHNQLKLNRLFRSKSIMAWAELLRDAVCGKLDLMDSEDREMPFYRDLSEKDDNRVRSVVDRLVSWNGWTAPIESPIDRIFSDKKSAVKEWFKNNGLTAGYLMGAAG